MRFILYFNYNGAKPFHKTLSSMTDNDYHCLYVDTQDNFVNFKRHLYLNIEHFTEGFKRILCTTEITSKVNDIKSQSAAFDTLKQMVIFQPFSDVLTRSFNFKPGQVLPHLSAVAGESFIFPSQTIDEYYASREETLRNATAQQEEKLKALKKQTKLAEVQGRSVKNDSIVQPKVSNLKKKAEEVKAKLEDARSQIEKLEGEFLAADEGVDAQVEKEKGKLQSKMQKKKKQVQEKIEKMKETLSSLQKSESSINKELEERTALELQYEESLQQQKQAIETQEIELTKEEKQLAKKLALKDVPDFSTITAGNTQNTPIILDVEEDEDDADLTSARTATTRDLFARATKLLATAANRTLDINPDEIDVLQPEDFQKALR